MSVSNAEIAGLIADAEGAAVSFGYFACEKKYEIDAPDVSQGIESRMAWCSKTMKRCLTHMLSMNRDSVRSCIHIANMTMQTLRMLQRLKPQGDLEHVLILEEVFCEERLGEMYANQADIQIKERELQEILDDDFFDPADWWKRT